MREIDKNDKKYAYLFNSDAEIYELADETVSAMVEAFLKSHPSVKKKIGPDQVKKQILLGVLLGVVMLISTSLMFLFHRLLLLFIGIDAVCVLIFLGKLWFLSVQDYLESEVKKYPDDDFDYILESKIDTVVDRKKVTLPALIILAVVVLVPCIIFFKPVSIYEENSFGYSLRYYSAAVIMPGEVVIPETYNNLPVTGIRGNVFQNLPIKSVVLPPYISEIRGSTFENCLFLESIYLPDTVTRIGENAFKGCVSLKTVRWSPSLQKIGKKAFYHCYSLDPHYDEIPGGCTVKGDAFDGVKSK